jgi:hypothetical protein
MAMTFVVLFLFLAGLDYLYFSDTLCPAGVTRESRRWYRCTSRPFWQVFFGAVSLVAGLLLSVRVWVAVRRRRAFEIGADGIRTWPLFQKSRFMAWSAMVSARLAYENLVIKGTLDTGRTGHIWLDLAGHDRKALSGIVIFHHRDIADALY